MIGCVERVVRARAPASDAEKRPPFRAGLRLEENGDDESEDEEPAVIREPDE
jgi:hypothetical protein